jgi:hypothetical protein
LLVGGAVKEVHLGEGRVHLLENVRQLGLVHIVRHNVQNRAQLLSFLLKTKFLVHVRDSLLEASLEGRNLIAQLLLLILGGFRLSK